MLERGIEYIEGGGPTGGRLVILRGVKESVKHKFRVLVFFHDSVNQDCIKALS